MGRKKGVHAGVGRPYPDPVQEDEEYSQRLGLPYRAVRRSIVTFTER
jgi:hypothetical protein